MNNKEIIKESFLFPIRNYKYFIIVTILFLIAELCQEFFLEMNDSDISMVIMFILSIIIPLLALGISLEVIFHLLNKKRGAPEISFNGAIKEALKDTLLESYYFILALIITVILSIPTGLFQKIEDIPSFISDLMISTEGISVFKIMGSLPDLAILDTVESLKITLAIFIIMFVILFSICTISKIDLEKHENFKQSFNIIRMLNIIKKIGILKYSEFLLLIMIFSVLVANIIYILNDMHVIGSLISALLEAFTLFFFLHSFAKLYPE